MSEIIPNEELKKQKQDLYTRRRLLLKEIAPLDEKDENYAHLAQELFIIHKSLKQLSIKKSKPKVPWKERKSKVPKKGIGKYLTDKRIQLGLSVTEMALRVGISPTYYCRLEHLYDRLPSEKVLKALAIQLNANVDALFALKGKVSEDLCNIICRYPKEIGEFLRLTAQQSWTIEQWIELKQVYEDSY